jgi:2-C-methyl-D-erythritol 2,4-cyclodiphosphate synthase
MSFRIGQGFDSHALAAGRRLVIGGVEIAHAKGLAGHSDADVLIHAICDALLGAAALGDIGRHFPDSDPKYKDADSRALLRAVAKKVREAGYDIANVDATVIAEAPKLAPHIPAMVKNLAGDLGVGEREVNVKAKTAEKMGALGRGEGIAAQAIALLVPK